jgi:hypothetical protein
MVERQGRLKKIRPTIETDASDPFCLKSFGHKHAPEVLSARWVTTQLKVVGNLGLPLHFKLQ